MFFIDPFIWQFVIVPILTIGTGVLIAIRFEKAYIALLVTLLFNVGIELAMGFLYDPYEVMLTAYNFWFPAFSFVIAYTFIGKRQTERQMEKRN
ncbi:hypothetical protein [Exiguobacterium chiriqhucha]|uniref:Uncharacterized protein n=1 Tax=Exiguobacterium chiriqhucha RW-2 TaxID=1345023 RepID=U1LZN8_9BACL|nr:hypothetical protein [Exiguobacterium chiriqhucha]ERG67852.1 hypothetical protein M467_11220 [Exiguobacterium chiriqhucha RW-2]